MKASAVLGIRPEAIPAWLALGAALDRLSDQGQHPVCHQRPDQWSQDAKPYARQDAVEACTYCPIKNACGAFADANVEVSGVWGGRDRSPCRPSAVAASDAVSTPTAAQR